MNKMQHIMKEIEKEIETEEAKPQDEQWPLYLKTMKDLLIQAKDTIPNEAEKIVN